MRLNSFAAVARALDDAGVRYLIAGGLAVNAHGYLRYTNDVDLVVQLVPENIVRAFAALASIGYSPLVWRSRSPSRRSTRARWRNPCPGPSTYGSFP